ncbi:MAG: protoglobin domain-containing protein [Desertimonas sp.]
MTTDIHGYTYDGALTASPVTIADLDQLLSTLVWTDDDAAALARAGTILESQIDDILDVWYGFVGSHPHLVVSFNGADGQPSADYLAAVRERFGQWIRDLCGRRWDQRWLDYQHEIARRHTDTMGATDSVGSDQTHIPLRFLIAFIWPITATVRSFLADPTHNQGADAAAVDAMHTAWFKAVTLTVALWAQPYAVDRW